MTIDYSQTTGSLSPAIGIALGSIVAKVVGIVSWSWVWALLPVWLFLGSACFAVALLIIGRGMLFLVSTVLTVLNDRSAESNE